MKRFVKLGWATVGILIPVVLLMGAGRVSKPVEPDTPLETSTGKPSPLVVNFLYASGLANGAWGNFNAARNYFARIREIDPASSLGYSPVGRTYVAQGQLGKALYWMNEALMADPQDYESGAWMVLLYDCLEDFDSAAYWSEWLNSRITNQSMPMATQASHHYLSGNFELALQYSNLALRLNLPDRRDSNAIFMRIKRDEALGAGNPESGIRIFATHFPELFLPVPEITADNIGQATDLALLLKMAERSAEANRLLTGVLAAYDQPFLTGSPYGLGLMPIKAEALAILGENSKALVELRRIIDQGWRLHWRWKTELNPNFNGVRQSGLFQDMVAELEADMTRQRTLSQKMAVGSGIGQTLDSGSN